MNAKATMALSDMLCANLLHALDTRRDFLYIWEREAFKCLAKAKHPMNAWTRDRLEQFKEGEKVLTNWMKATCASRPPISLKVLQSS